MDYRLEKDILTNKTQYFFSLLGPRFEVMNELMADSLSRHFGHIYKPIYIFSLGSTEATDKAAWITEGLGTDIKNYANIAGWIWFNENVGSGQNWLVNSDPAALAAFKSVLP